MMLAPNYRRACFSAMIWRYCGEALFGGVAWSRRDFPCKRDEKELKRRRSARSKDRHAFS
jgi:hypothetical protein